MYPAFNPKTLHYGIGCVDGGATDGSLTLTVSSADPASRITVDGVQVANRDGQITVRNLHRESDIDITVSGSDGAATIYTVHCIDSEWFPDVEVTKKAGVDGVFEDLVVFTHDYAAYGGYLIVMDNNGVPRVRRHISARLSPFHRVFEGNRRLRPAAASVLSQQTHHQSTDGRIPIQGPPPHHRHPGGVPWRGGLWG